MLSKADQILDAVLRTLELSGASPDAIYLRIDEIVEALRIRNDEETIAVGTTGRLTERLCEFGLNAACPLSWRRLGQEWKWVGDFYVTGAPFNTIVSVKSFKAKERLLSSGSGNLLSPTIGFGLFDDPKEWSERRVVAYLFRAFVVIYMPSDLLEQLPSSVREIKNINNLPFLRSNKEFVHDIRRAMRDDLLDPRRL